MRMNLVRRTVFVELSNAGSDDDDPGQRNPTANGVNDRRAGKVNESPGSRIASKLELNK